MMGWLRGKHRNKIVVFSWISFLCIVIFRTSNFYDNIGKVTESEGNNDPDDEIEVPSYETSHELKLNFEEEILPIQDEIQLPRTTKTVKLKSPRRSIQYDTPTGWKLPWTSLIETEKLFKREEVTYREYYLDMEVNQNTPIFRDVPDTRPKECANLSSTYNRILPKASIIVPYHNEAWPNLLRLLMSIYQHTPVHLVEEIILVDDDSTRENLKAVFREYVSLLPKLRLMHTSKREGLIRTRILGSRQAQGEVLVFLDAHSEVNRQWLEPLLHEIQKDPSTIAIPMIDGINPDNLEYFPSNHYHRGTFTWDMQYIWIRTPDEIMKSRTEPIRTATTIGCAMAVNRDFFSHIGEYDTDLNIWGGENLEISFKAWMCGGSMLIIPCSQVGHMFRVRLPYTFPDGGYTLIEKNLQRVAEVWMGDYSKFFYLTQGKRHDWSMEQRHSLMRLQKRKNELKCHSFEWYLHHIATDVQPPPRKAILFGQLINISFYTCATYNPEAKNLLLRDCTERSAEQYFYFSDTNTLQQGDKCLMLDLSKGRGVKTVFCDNRNVKLHWTFSPILPSEVEDSVQGIDVLKPGGSFRVERGGDQYCLAAAWYNGQVTLLGKKCDFADKAQYWLFTYKLNYHINWQEKSNYII